jgi:hypothetical protein
MGMNTLFVVSVLVALSVLARWMLVYFRPGRVGKLDTHQAKTSAKLPPLPPTTETVIADLPAVDVRPWLEKARVPPSPSIDFGLLGLDEDREADDVAIWRTVRRVLAMRHDAKAGMAN